MKFKCVSLTRHWTRYFRWPVVFPFAAMFLATTCVNAEPVDEMANDRLHSDLPIFGHGGDNEWPQHVYYEDTFGCSSRIAFGDWAIRDANADEEGESYWYRFQNYGVFHCWANTQRAHEREQLDGAEVHPSFFVFLGESRVGERDIELWTIQIGVVPGSDYLLLSRSPGDGVIEEFTVLQTECPRSNVRDGGILDILLTRYCAVNSRAELLRLARRMAQRPPLGTMTIIPDDDQFAEDGRL